MEDFPEMNLIIERMEIQFESGVFGVKIKKVEVIFFMKSFKTYFGLQRN